jgi:hypothetical protein
MPNVNVTGNAQAIECKYDPNSGGYWYPDPVPCEPVMCKYPPPGSSLSYTFRTETK